MSIGIIRRPRFKPRIVAGLAAALLGALASLPAEATIASCTTADVQAAAPSGMTIKTIPDGLLPTGAPTATMTGGVLDVPANAGAGTPEYCAVTGTVVTNPATGKTANFEIILPTPKAWNGKFLFSGCAGLCGLVFPGPTEGIAKGYAIASTDDGHTALNDDVFDGSWALIAPGVPNTDALTDFYFRAVHTVIVAGKSLAESWEKGSLSHSYYTGCSDGGREGMVEATRFPDDFDGVIAGDPFFDIRGETLGGYKDAKGLLRSNQSYIPPALLAVVDAAIYANCDAADGVVDGLIQNPAKCSFNPAMLQCKAGTTSNCLNPDQVDTLNAYFNAARDPSGLIAYEGYPTSDLNTAPGGSFFAWVEAAGPAANIAAAEPWGTAPPASWLFADNMLRYLIYQDADFNSNADFPFSFSNIVSDAAVALIDERTEAGDGDVPSAIQPFITANKKLILYHGYSDGLITPYRTVRYYEDLAAISGGFGTLQETVRLFMEPGMYHCGGGPGPNTFDTLSALESWVEDGIAPEAIPASNPVTGRTMPLCKFPEQAHYLGTGDVDNAANWICPPNDRSLLEVGPAGLAAGLVGPQLLPAVPSPFDPPEGSGPD